MSRRSRMLFTVVLLILCSIEMLIPQTVYAKEKKRILIDAGHGGIDGGAVGSDGSLEKDINLVISKKLKDVLAKEDYEVIMSREEDKGLYTDDGTIRKKKLEDLHNRNDLIKKSECDMFISIHLNIFPERQYYGAQVWCAANNPSRKFGVMLQKSLRENLDPSNKREARCGKEDYIILRDCPDIPAVIVECGFLSNYAEGIKLKDDSYQQKIAEAVAKSVEVYFQEE